jgi:hypothetical protein
MSSWPLTMYGSTGLMRGDPSRRSVPSRASRAEFSRAMRAARSQARPAPGPASSAAQECRSHSDATACRPWRDAVHRGDPAAGPSGLGAVQEQPLPADLRQRRAAPAKNRTARPMNARFSRANVRPVGEHLFRGLAVRGEVVFSAEIAIVHSGSGMRSRYIDIGGNVRHAHLRVSGEIAHTALSDRRQPPVNQHGVSYRANWGRGQPRRGQETRPGKPQPPEAPIRRRRHEYFTFSTYVACCLCRRWSWLGGFRVRRAREQRRQRQVIGTRSRHDQGERRTFVESVQHAVVSCLRCVGEFARASCFSHFSCQSAGVHQHRAERALRAAGCRIRMHKPAPAQSDDPAVCHRARVR